MIARDVNITGSWVKGGTYSWELSVLCLQLFCESKIMSKLKKFKNTHRKKSTLIYVYLYIKKVFICEKLPGLLHLFLQNGSIAMLFLLHSLRTFSEIVYMDFIGILIEFWWRCTKSIQIQMRFPKLITFCYYLPLLKIFNFWISNISTRFKVKKVWKYIQWSVILLLLSHCHLIILSKFNQWYFFLCPLDKFVNA